MEKIHKTDAEWRAQLTQEQYEITRLSAASSTTRKGRDPIIASAVTCRCSHPTPNSPRGLAGPAFLHRSTKTTSPITTTPVTACAGQRSPVLAAMPTWVMCSTTGPNRLAYATVSTQFRSISSLRKTGRHDHARKQSHICCGMLLGCRRQL